MNRREKAVLARNWEVKKGQSQGRGFQADMDISRNCYVAFGTYGIGVYKYRNGKWHRKIVNDWKSLTFDQFMQRFEEEEWEVA